jgi:SEC-C motif-containing protein
MAECPCSSGRGFDECCRPIIEGERQAETAEELMRSRYSAYATGAIDFLVESTWPAGRKTIDKRSMRAWSRESEWTGLEVVGTHDGGPGDERGSVEFIARYRRDGEERDHHEIAEFRRREGRWYFLDGKPGGTKTFVREEPKVGRNDPCPCGSGRKYKKCCGAR